MRKPINAMVRDRRRRCPLPLRSTCTSSGLDVYDRFAVYFIILCSHTPARSFTVTVAAVCRRGSTVYRDHRRRTIVTSRRRAKRARPCVVECAFHQRVSSNGFSTVELQSNGSRISTYKSLNFYKLRVLLLTNFDI